MENRDTRTSPLRNRINMFTQSKKSPDDGELNKPAQVPYQKNLTESLRTMQHAIHQNAVEHGWWDEPREDGTVLALIHAEVSECLEALREGNPPDKQCPGFSQGEIELADVVIRIMDFCERKGWSLGKAIVAKHEFNKGRPFMHGGKEF